VVAASILQGTALMSALQAEVLVLVLGTLVGQAGASMVGADTAGTDMAAAKSTLMTLTLAQQPSWGQAHGSLQVSNSQQGSQRGKAGKTLSKYLCNAWPQSEGTELHRSASKLLCLSLLGLLSKQHHQLHAYMATIFCVTQLYSAPLQPQLIIVMANLEPCPQKAPVQTVTCKHAQVCQQASCSLQSSWPQNI